MKLWFLLFSLVPIAGFAYIFWHSWQILPFPSPVKWTVVALMALCVVIFFCNFIFGLDSKPMNVSIALYEIGNSTLFIGLYVIMLFILLDILCLIHIIPRSFLHGSWIGTLTVVGIIAAFFIYGYVHYNNKVRIPMEIRAQHPLKKPVKLVMISDVHLGYHNRKAEFERWIDLINKETPDLILVAGDIIDGSIRAVREQHLEEDFHKFKAPIYAIFGNHEYYTGREESIKFYHDAGIHLLLDSVANVGELTILGRDDRTNPNRKSVAQLMKEAGPNHGFTILLDHQPYHLEEAQKAGVDYQFSGHTHYGQVWPISRIEDAIYEDAFGPLTKGATQYYVSSGIGIWGGKFRIGTRSEYIVATIK